MNPSSFFSAGFHARFERVADAAGTNAEGIHRDAQPLGHFPAALDFLTPSVAVVLDDQFALLS